MSGRYQRRLLFRLLTLSVLTICLSILYRGSNKPPAEVQGGQSLIPTQSPTVMVETQPGAPLVIFSPRPLSADPKDTEIAFELTNVSGKPVRAYAIKQTVEAGAEQQSSVSLHNLELANAALQPGQSDSLTDNYQVLLSDKEHHITLSLDYVEFSDGGHWGLDIAKSGEYVAGQRAAAYLLSKRLMRILDAGDPADVTHAIEAGGAEPEPPAGRSEQWKAGFRNGSKFVAARLSESNKRGGASEVARALRQLAQRFKGVD